MDIKILQDEKEYKFIVEKDGKPVYVGWQKTAVDARKAAEDFIKKNEI